MTLPDPLQRLHDLDRSSPQFSSQLAELLDQKEYIKCLPDLHSENLVWLVEYLDRALTDISDPASRAFQRSLHELERICSTQVILPKSCTLSPYLLNTGPSFASGYAYEGTFGGSKVFVKHIRMHNEDTRKVKKALYPTAVVWKRLEHQHIVPLLGITPTPLQFISKWMPGGDLTGYITNHPDADRLCLLSEVADGLNYLHSCNVIHGHLKGSNVLVDTTGRARITGFGLAMVTQNLDSIRNAPAENGHSARWIAPEILDDRGTFSKEADVFSFSMVTIEAFTGAVPFSDKPPDTVIFAVVGCERPPRPTDPTLTDALWALIQRCWDQEANRRPRAPDVSRGLGIPALRRLITRPLAADERISLIKEVFSNRDEAVVVRCLHGDDARSFVDVVYEMLDTLAPSLQRKCLSVLCRICGRSASLPGSVQIPLCYDPMDTPLYRGGFTELWEGEHLGRKVAIKVLKGYSASDFDKITRRFCKEVVTWKALRHQNLLPLLGVTMGNDQLAMVSEWMVDGNINEFVKAHGDVNRFELLQDAVRGLIYLHGEGTIHGSLKGANILIDQRGHPRLTDFGLITIISDPTYPTTPTASANAGTARWTSPELLDPGLFGFKNSRPTKESDCYALGMVIYEVLSGKTPLRLCEDHVVSQSIIDGMRPGRPGGLKRAWFTDDLWETLGLCWLSQPKSRPTAEAVLECLERVSPAWRPLPPSADGDAETDVDDDSYLVLDNPESRMPPGPPMEESSHALTAENTDASGRLSPSQVAPSQSSGKLDLEKSAAIVDRAPHDSLGEPPSLDTSATGTHDGLLDPPDVAEDMVASPPSALKLARMIEHPDRTPYPEGVNGPKPELNVNSEKGKFVYDREFLLQFMGVCTEKPDVPLDPIGFDAGDDQERHRMARVGVRHGGTSAAVISPVSEMMREEIFAAKKPPTSSTATGSGVPFDRPTPKIRTSSPKTPTKSNQGAPPKTRTRSKRGKLNKDRTADELNDKAGNDQVVNLESG